jgi:hypothetical protein
MVRHTYNPSYLGGRNRRMESLKPFQTKLAGDPISKTNNTRRLGA